MLTKHFDLYWKRYEQREKFDINKPLPYDKEEAYLRKKAEQSSLLPEGHPIETNQYRIAFHKYQDFSIAQVARMQIGQKYRKMTNRINILDRKPTGFNKKPSTKSATNVENYGKLL